MVFYETQPDRGSYFHTHILALKRFGYRVGVINLELIPLNKAILQGRLRNAESYMNDEGVHTYRTSVVNWTPLISFAKKSLINVTGLKVFKKYVYSYGVPDIIHAHSAIFGGLLAAEIKSKFKIPFVISEHLSSLVIDSIENWRRRYAKKVFEYADALISVSPQFAKRLSQIFSIDFKSWYCVPNLLDYRFQHLLPNFNISGSSKKFIFLSIGNLVSIKGHQYLLQAFAAAFAKNTAVALYIVGSGPMRKHLERLVENLRISKQVVFYGQLDRGAVVDIIINSNVYVSSSKFETFGVALIEALAGGLPVIATACGGPESIVNKFNGILVPPCDVGSLATAMVRIYEFYDLYNRHQIRKDCLVRYGDLPILNKLSEIYNYILNKYPPKKEYQF